MAQILTLTYYAGSLIALVAALAVILGRGRPPAWVSWGTAVGAIVFLLGVFQIMANPPTGVFDFSAFRESGGEVLAGRDPIDTMQSVILPPLNPPTAFPLFAAFALGSMRLTFAVWVALSAAMGLALVPMAHRALADADATTRALPSAAIAALAVLVALSNAARACLGSGQLSILTAFALILALGAQSRGRSIRAGIWLAAATVKVGTMVPFLLLFVRRIDLRAWLALIVVTAGLCLSTGRVLDTPRRVVRWLDGIGRMSRPGSVNDFTYAAPDNGDMIGLDHAFYRAGLKSRGSAKLAQWLVMGLLGGWIAWEVIARTSVSEGAKRGLVAFLTMLFLYHRLSDAVILAIPLVHATGRARASTGRTRALFAASAIAILPILLMQRTLMKSLRDVAERGSMLSRVVEIIVLPYACWLLIAAMILLRLGENAWARSPVSTELERESSRREVSS